MRIAILTINNWFQYNYGQKLQMYALYNVLQDMGHSVRVIRLLNYLTKKTYIKAIISCYNHVLFVSKNIKQTEKIDHSTLKSLNSKFDAFVVGSDQVWRPEYLHGDNTYFLDFVDDDKIKLSYAASFGIDDTNKFYDTKDRISVLLNRFRAVSIREKSAIYICDYLDVPAKLVLDPTLLYSSEWWIKKINPTTKKLQNIMFFLDNNEYTHKGYKNISHKFKIGPFILNYKISDWISYIMSANTIVTDSYHCMLFCIIFHKNFYVLLNQNKGIKRITDFFDSVCIPSNRIIKSISDLDSLQNIDIDYNIVDEKLSRIRNISIDFLKRNLNE